MTLGTTGLDDSSPVLVDITTGAGTLSTDIQNLDTDTGLLTTAIGTLTTAVNAFTATQTSTAPVAGTVTCPANAGTAIILGTQACTHGLWITSPSPTNTINVVIGNSTTNLPITMAPGTTILLPVANANLIFCKSTTVNAAQVLQWMAL